MLFYFVATFLLATATAADGLAAKFESYPYLISNLSPLITYSPADAWTHTVWGSNTTAPGASVSFQALGWQLIVNGDRAGNATWLAQPDYQASPAPPPVFPEGANEPPGLLTVNAAQRDLHIRNVSIINGQGAMNVTHVQQATVLPIGEYRQVNITRQSGIINESINPFFSGSDWTIDKARAVTSTARVPRYNLGPSQGNNSTIPSPWWAGEFDPAFPTDLTLSTTSDSPLSFDIPAGKALLQWYGAVGPDYGRFELKITPGESSDYPRARGSYVGSAERPVDSGRELMMVAYLDPRVAYKGEICSLDKGKRLDVDGLFLSTYVEDPSVFGSGDIVEEFNENSSTGGAFRLGVSALMIVGSASLALLV